VFNKDMKNKTTILFLFLLILTLFSSSVLAIGNSGVLHYYNTNTSSFTDSIGTKNGTITGATWSDANDDWYFDGTEGTKIQLGNLNTDTTKSISFWVYKYSGSVGYNGNTMIFCDIGTNLNANFFCIRLYDDRIVPFQDSQWTLGDITLGEDAYHHIVITCDGTTIKYWEDGVNKKNVTDAYCDLTAKDMYFEIAENDYDNVFSKIKIKKLGMFDYTLTSENVADLYNSGTGLLYPFYTAPVLVLPEIISLSDSAVNSTIATLNGEFDYNEYTNITAGFIVNGTTYCETDFVGTDGIEELECNLTGLYPLSYYEYEFCLDIGEPIPICSVTQNFTTTDLNSPFINVFNAFDINKFNATIGATLFYMDFNSTQLDFYINNNIFDTQNWSGSGSQYTTAYPTGLYPETTYNYSVCVSYVDIGFVLQTDCTTNKTFTTDAGTMPFISSIDAFDITQTKATLGTTFLYNDFSNVTLDFWFDGLSVYSHNFVQSGASEFVDFDLTGLSEHTQYEWKVCLDYGGDNISTSCSAYQYFNTTYYPIVTLLEENLITKDSANINFNIDFKDVTSLEYKIWDEDWEVANTTNSYLWENLTPSTTYAYFLEFRGVGTDDFNSTTGTFATYYENALDDVWNEALQGSSMGKMLLGFFVLLSTIFFAVNIFGRFNIQLSMVGILILAIIGSIIPYLMNLFPFYLFILIVGGSIILVFLKNMFGGENQNV
jgi:hypothetical protein